VELLGALRRLLGVDRHREQARGQATGLLELEQRAPLLGELLLPDLVLRVDALDRLVVEDHVGLGDRHRLGEVLAREQLVRLVHVGDLDRLGALGLRERDEVDVLAGRLGLRPPHADRVAELALALLDRARELLGMPDTGPIVPSGLMMPVIVTVGSIFSPVIVARKPPAIRPEADAPSMYPPDAAENEKSVRSLPSVDAATNAETQTPARHCDPVPPASSS